MTQSTAGIDPLYEAIAKYEEAANDLGALNVSVSGAYRGLTDALQGHGSVDDACYRFEMEAALQATAHDVWKLAAANLRQTVADGLIWKSWFDAPRKRCANCGSAEVYTDRFRGGWCSDCRSNNLEAEDQIRDRSLARHFDELARQPYGERGVLGTSQL